MFINIEGQRINFDHVFSYSLTNDKKYLKIEFINNREKRIKLSNKTNAENNIKDIDRLLRKTQFK